MPIKHQENGFCACPMCSGAATEGSESGIVGERQPQMAPIFNDTQVIGQINSGAKWNGSTISYGFLQSSPYWDIGYEGNGFSAFSTQQILATRSIMGLWDDLIAPSFSESGSNQQYANVKFGNTTTSINYAHAYYPGSYLWAGEVWLNAQTYSGLYSPAAGNYYWMTILHEVGHAIGLSHPGAYNGGAPTYAANAEYAQDTHQWTVMSYFSASYTGADWNGGTGWQYAQTPMVHDVLTIQAIYGADTTTRTGNTVYGFNSNAGNPLFDFSTNRSPVLTIYDAGGIDTLDLSGFSMRAIINLQPGTYTSAGGISSSMTYNIGIAGNTIIENAYGGLGDDIIYGNSANNILVGGAGSDRMYGYAGNDTIQGGSGTDWAVFSYAIATYSFTFGASGIGVFGEGSDFVHNDVEWLQFADINLTYAGVSSFFAEVEIESLGNDSLFSQGNSYFIEPSGGGRINITVNGAPVGPLSSDVYEAIQVESDGGAGYNLLWRHVNGGYALWQLDGSGELQAASWLTESEWINQEIAFSFDLNGDGQIGHFYSTIESSGDYALLSSSAGQFFIEDSSNNKIAVTMGGAPVGPNPSSPYTALHVEDYGVGGFELLWQYSGGGYAVWQLDGSGAFVGASFLNPSDYPDHEVVFSLDLNGDGRIGHYFDTIESAGDYALLLSSSGQFFIEDSLSNRIGVTMAGAPVGQNPASPYTALHVEDIGTGGYEILWQYSGGGYAVWQLDASGGFVGASFLNPSDYSARETIFSLDLNNDGRIGNSPVTIEALGDYKLLVGTGGTFLIEDSTSNQIGVTIGGSPVGPNPSSPYQAIQVEEDGSGGFELLWSYSGGGHAVWQLDSSGAFVTGSFLNASDYPAHEAIFSMDLNGDGQIGLSWTTIEAVGDYKLVSYSGQYYIEDSGGTRTTITIGGAPVGPDPASPYTAVHIEDDGAGGFDLLWQYSGGGYAVWELDGSGAFEGGLWMNEADYAAYEDVFQFDLNGDNSIGAVPPASALRELDDEFLAGIF